VTPRWTTRARRLALLAAGHAAFWLLLYPQLSPRDPPPSPLRSTEFRAATIAEVPAGAARVTPEEVAVLLDTITMAPITLPWRSCGVAQRHVIRATVEVPQIPADGFGILPRVVADNA
jgi:hypothetical protein